MNVQLEKKFMRMKKRSFQGLYELPINLLNCCPIVFIIGHHSVSELRCDSKRRNPAKF